MGSEDVPEEEPHPNEMTDIARADTGDELLQSTFGVVEPGADIGDDLVGSAVCSAVALQQRYLTDEIVFLSDG